MPDIRLSCCCFDMRLWPSLTLSTRRVFPSAATHERRRGSTTQAQRHRVRGCRRTAEGRRAVRQTAVAVRSGGCAPGRSQLRQGRQRPHEGQCGPGVAHAQRVHKERGDEVSQPAPCSGAPCPCPPSPLLPGTALPRSLPLCLPCPALPCPALLKTATIYQDAILQLRAASLYRNSIL